MPDDYRRRQTLKNAERYITPELKAFEDKALSAQERALAREKLLYDAAARPARAAHSRAAARRRRARRARRAGDLRASARTRSTAPRPSSPPSPCIEIDGGRHPVVEAQVEQLHRQRLRGSRGAPAAAHHRPEHGRQIHLHAAGRADRAAGALRLVRAGATRARSAPLDQIFTRIGAADDLAGGRSTFMVEMTEAAYILHDATARASC